MLTISILTHGLIRASLYAPRWWVRLKLTTALHVATVEVSTNGGTTDPVFTLWYPHPPPPLANGIMGLAGIFCFGL